MCLPADSSREIALLVVPIRSATASCVRPARERALSIWLATWYSSSSAPYAWAKPFRARALGEGLFELRPHGRSGIGRAFYCFMLARRIVVLHAFIKKSQQTPDRELKLARKRLKELQGG